MEYVSVRAWAESHGVSERTARNYCAQGKIDGAFLVGKTWNIPAEASLPTRKKRASVSPLLGAHPCCNRVPVNKLIVKSGYEGLYGRG